VDKEVHRIVDFIVSFERRLETSRFTVDRERKFAGPQRIASGFIELDGARAEPAIILDQPTAAVSDALKHSIRLRWIGLQRQLKNEGWSATEAD
jgi:hypothetical protein